MALPKALLRHKKKVFAACLVAELASIPVAAQVADKVSFEIPVRVVAVPVEAQPDRPGLQSFLVASNGPFAVEVADVVGRVDVEVSRTGYAGGLQHGGDAQMPGPREGCARSRGLPTRVYTSRRKTAARRGSVQSQSVRVDVRHGGVATPTVRIVPMEDATPNLGMLCES